MKHATATVCACSLAALAQTAAAGAAQITLVSPNTPGPAPPPLAAGSRSRRGRTKYASPGRSTTPRRSGSAWRRTEPRLGRRRPADVDPRARRLPFRRARSRRRRRPRRRLPVAARAAPGRHRLAGFSPGKRLLGARITLRPTRAVTGLPLRVSVERRGGVTRVRLENRTARQFAVTRGTAPLPALQAVLARTRRELGRELAAGRPPGRPRAGAGTADRAADRPDRLPAPRHGDDSSRRWAGLPGSTRRSEAPTRGAGSSRCAATGVRRSPSTRPSSATGASCCRPHTSSPRPPTRCSPCRRRSPARPSRCSSRVPRFAAPGGASTTTYRYATARAAAAAPGGERGRRRPGSARARADRDRRPRRPRRPDGAVGAPVSGSVTEAVVMAAGEGRRLRPLTERYAKAVLPIDGRPVILGLLEELCSAGVGRVTVVTGHLADQVERLLGGAPAELRFVRQTAPSARPTPSAGPCSNRRTSSSGRIRSSLPGPWRPSSSAHRPTTMRSRSGRGRARCSETACAIEAGLVTRFQDGELDGGLVGAPLWLVRSERAPPASTASRALRTSYATRWSVRSRRARRRRDRGRPDAGA